LTEYVAVRPALLLECILDDAGEPLAHGAKKTMPRVEDLSRGKSVGAIFIGR
jgi:hypothetical protein